MNQPDKFDMWSAGMVLLQLAFPPLRSDSAVIAFNTRLEGFGYDLRRWRAEEGRKARSELAEGFALLDADGGAGWELLCSVRARACAFVAR